jgi:hypothetical protein
MVAACCEHLTDLRVASDPSSYSRIAWHSLETSTMEVEKVRSSETRCALPDYTVSREKTIA